MQAIQMLALSILLDSTSDIVSMVGSDLHFG